MSKIVTVKLTDEEHKEFSEVCKKTGTHRPFFVKDAIMDKVRKINVDKMDCE